MFVGEDEKITCTLFWMWWTWVEAHTSSVCDFGLKGDIIISMTYFGFENIMKTKLARSHNVTLVSINKPKYKP